MNKLLEDVNEIYERVFRILGERFKNLIDHNLIFEMLEERQGDISEDRVAEIEQILLQMYADDATVAVELEDTIKKEDKTRYRYTSHQTDVDKEDSNHHALVQSFSAMFPDTPLDYIWEHAEELVGKPAAIERFTKQLLENPLPPTNWAVKGIMLECECCFSDSPEEKLVHCPVGHTFCQECIRAATNVAMGDGKVVIRCLVECREEIHWRQLQKALEASVLIKLEQKRQAEEVTAAKLSSLVECPFCPYQAVMEDPQDKVFLCRNPECGKDSCRLCKELSHIPLRCQEVPKVEGARKEIEEKLSMAMLRQCWQCQKLFFKEEGCNRMTCTCGAEMCYLCKAQIKTSNYDHFYGQGGSPTPQRTCPLWSDNQALHKKEVTTAAIKAKEELALDSNLNQVLKIDVKEGKVVDATKGTATI